MPSPRIRRVDAPLVRDISLRLQVYLPDIIIYFRKEYLIKDLFAIKESQYFVTGLLQPS